MLPLSWHIGTMEQKNTETPMSMTMMVTAN